MPKFSIIVPVYNVEEYISDCLDSICKQSYTDFEVIVVNDGSPDHSDYFIKEFEKKDRRIRSFKKRNGGLSSARNYGVTKARGEYLLFVDSDDTIEPHLLRELNKVIEKNGSIDVIRFGIKEINQYTKKTTDLENAVFDVCSGEEGFLKLIQYPLVEPAWSYAYRKEFFTKHQFKYAEGKLHEDYGLTPYLLLKAHTIMSIPYHGYRYLIRENSIMTSPSEENLVKRMNDCLYHFDQLQSWINKDKQVSESTKKVYRSFIANILLEKAMIVPKSYVDFYIQELKKRHIGNYLLSNTWKRFLKKMMVTHFLKTYIYKVARKIR